MRLPVLAACLAAIVLAGCGGASHHRPTRQRAADAPATTASATGPGVSADATTAHNAPRTAASPPPSPELRALRATLARLLVKAGPATGALVYDLTAHAELFGLRDQDKRPPASVEKLYTTVALLQELGPGARLQTAVLGAGHLGPRGVWHGSLYLRGGGDPTLGDAAFNRQWELGYGPTGAQLVHQLTAAGIRRVTGTVIGDPSLLDSRPGGPATGFAPDIPDYGGELSALTYDHGSTSGALGPAAFAVKELVLTMRAAHIEARAATAPARTPPGAAQLASVSSPAMSVLVRLMDVPSDDLFADLLTEQLGAQRAGVGTLAAGASQIAQVIAGYDLHPKIVDGSGLSRSDGSSPREVVYLLRSVWHTPLGRTLWDSLPVVGVSGTVQTIATRTAAQGRCIAKTGTLNYVTNLAGYCESHGGHVLAFALFLDGPPNWLALPRLGWMVTAIARY